MITTQQTHQIGNSLLAKKVLEKVISQGISEFCLCAGSRNAPLVYPLIQCPEVKVYNWPEERSAAFFALGRIKATGHPAAIVTTSGTAAAEVLPAAIEAHYTGLPLVIITADRPRRFRGTGAPQSVEQVGLYTCYAHAMLDIAECEEISLTSWDRRGPLHLNICFEEPNDHDSRTTYLEPSFCPYSAPSPAFSPDPRYEEFIKKTRYPLVVVGSLHPSQKESAIQYLLQLGAPVYAEGISGIREDRRLEDLRITWMDNIWVDSARFGYPIDGILRIGGVPTIRLWRDIEHNKVPVCSISDVPFSGLSCADVIVTHLNAFFARGASRESHYTFAAWKEFDRTAQKRLQELFLEEPSAEQSLVNALTKKIPARSKVYLGNSLPIREWDLAATYHESYFQMSCSRGANGIDGQISTFLGFATPEQDNWALLGDLTVLYDLAAPWITEQLPFQSLNIALINNGGGCIFKRMYSHPAFYNSHSLSFKPFADFWNWNYEKWDAIPSSISYSQRARLIEIIPSMESTERFHKKLKAIGT